MSREFKLEIEDLTIGFRGRKVLEVPRFELARGEKVLLTGASGCGKSIFLKVLLGVLPESSVWSGRFLLRQDGGDGEPAAYPVYVRGALLRGRISAVFQDAINSLHPYRPVSRQCPSPEGREGRSKYQEFKLDPDYFSERMPRECSGGECQRLSLLFPYFDEGRDLLVMDEPLTDIDWISRKSIEACLLRFLEEPERSVVLVTHQPDWLPEMKHFAVRGGVMRLEAPPKKRTPMAAAAAPAAEEPAGPLLRIRLSEPYSFPGNQRFELRPFTLELAPGQSLGLIGESGCGKSTLLRIAAGLFSKSHYGSRFEVDLQLGENRLNPIMRIPRGERYRRLQLVQQNTTGTLIADETVGGNLEWIRRLKGVHPEPFEAMATRWGRKLRLFSDLGKLAGRRLSQLSVGMLRRYVLLRAFLSLDIYGGDRTPKLLLLDEISRGLDADNLRHLILALTEYGREHNVGCIAVSHDVDFIRASCQGFRMMFRGMLLPQRFTARDLEEVDANTRIRGLLNPYYHDFLARRDEAPHNDVSNGFGCLYARYFKCRNSADEGCGHDSFVANKRIDVCC